MAVKAVRSKHSGQFLWVASKIYRNLSHGAQAIGLPNRRASLTAIFLCCRSFSKFRQTQFKMEVQMERFKLNPQEAREEKPLFTQDDVISVYTSDQASEDGILFNVGKSAILKNDLCNFITTNLLLDMDIMKYDARVGSDVVKVQLALDLIEQAKAIVNREIANKLATDHFYSGMVRKLNGERIRIFICENETGKFTLMLPADY